MKKSFVFLTASIMMLTSCGNTSVYDTWKISFESNGGSIVDTIEVKDGELATKPANPVKENYTFVDWFVDSYLTVSFDWSKEITSNWTLYASWKSNKQEDTSGGDGGNTDSGDNTGGDSSGDTGGSTGDNTGGNTDSGSGSGDSGSGSTGGDSTDTGGSTGGDGSGDTGGSTGDNTDSGGEAGGDTGGNTDSGSGSGDSGSGSTGGDSTDTGGSTGGETGGDTDSGDTDTGDKTTSKGHGPDGSTLVSWYLVGSGSLWDESNGWTIAGGVQLYSNPNNSADKGCILSISFKVGDIFKVTDGGSNWFGYEKVNTWSDASNKGLSSFSGDSDGYGGNNFKCIVEGTYDMYVNSSGTFWIQDATN